MARVLAVLVLVGTTFSSACSSNGGAERVWDRTSHYRYAALDESMRASLMESMSESRSESVMARDETVQLLIERGYRVFTRTAADRLPFETAIPPGSVLLIRCGDQGDIALWYLGTYASVRCVAVDLVSGREVFAGEGGSVALIGFDGIEEATVKALNALPEASAFSPRAGIAFPADQFEDPTDDARVNPWPRALLLLLGVSVALVAWVRYLRRDPTPAMKQPTRRNWP